jgi:citrate lyase subunit beta / citryl-CoA lyase
MGVPRAPSRHAAPKGINDSFTINAGGFRHSPAGLCVEQTRRIAYVASRISDSMRSLLITSARTESDLAEAAASDADALVVDATATIAIPALRAHRPKGPLIHVRVGPLGTDLTAQKLGPIVSAAPDGIVFAGAEGRADILRLSAMIAAAEAIAGLPDGGIGIVAMMTTADGVLGVGSLPHATPRLHGIAWDSEALAASVGARSSRDTRGGLIDPCRAARSQCLLAAAAAGIPAFDTAYATSTNGAALEAETIDARHQGFAGKLAVSRDQVPVINAVFGKDD